MPQILEIANKGIKIVTITIEDTEGIQKDPSQTSGRENCSVGHEIALDGISIILDTAEIKISELEDKAIETIQNEAQTKKRNFWKKEQITSELWNKFTRSNICVNEVPNQRGKTEKMFEEIMAEIFPDLIKTS